MIRAKDAKANVAALAKVTTPLPYPYPASPILSSLLPLCFNPRFHGVPPGQTKKTKELKEEYAAAAADARTSHVLFLALAAYCLVCYAAWLYGQGKRGEVPRGRGSSQ